MAIFSPPSILKLGPCNSIYYKAFFIGNTKSSTKYNKEKRKVRQEADQADKGEFIERTTSVY